MVRSTGAMTSSPTRASAAGSSTGAGQYAPIPPVFGPRSPSRSRLWSCAGGSSTYRAPSHRAMTLTSSPSSTSSSTSVRPASPSAASARTAATASSTPCATMTPLPAASPSAFTTTEPRPRAQASASAHRGERPPGGRADPGGEHHLLGEGLAALEPRGGGVGTEHRDARAPERVGHARHQRRLGPHHHQIGPRIAGERHHRRRAGRRPPGDSPPATPCPGCPERRSAP